MDRPENRSVLFEQRFWLQILGDHARFILNALAPTECEAIARAQHFIHVFDELLAAARRRLPPEALSQLNQQAYQESQNLRQFKLDLLREKLVGNLQLDLPPTFINHMLNELDEYMGTLCAIIQTGAPPAPNLIQQHLLWLLDAAGHAAAVNSHLDETEKDLQRQSLVFEENFILMYRKAVEFAGYLRTCLADFPELDRFNEQVKAMMDSFDTYLAGLESLILSHRLLGTLTPLMPDHMLREECYYLIKLAESSRIPEPDCDPARPRVQM